VFRGVHTTILRKLNVFRETGSTGTPTGAGLEGQWKDFIAQEECRRTAMVCFVLEAELCTLLHLPPSIASPDLHTYLPCSDALWNAPTAQAWHEFSSTTTRPILITELRKVISTESSFPMPPSVHLSPFGAQ
jgi:hypothetical protein